MSLARLDFLREVSALSGAVATGQVGSATGISVPPEVSVLRRGAAITGLIMLETFVRERTVEVLANLQNWPARYEDFPSKFRDRATIEALAHIEKFARMLRREGEDYEGEIFSEIVRMASRTPPAFQFTKFFAGDYTGNLSDSSVQELLGVFQIKDCWRGMHGLASDIGFGVPLVEEVLKTIVRNRHRSAHAAKFTPSATDMAELPAHLRLLGIGIDAALSTASKVALNDWRTWISGNLDWRSRIDIFFLVPIDSRFRLIRMGSKRATKIIDERSLAKNSLPRAAFGKTRLIVEQGSDGRPRGWDIV